MRIALLTVVGLFLLIIVANGMRLTFFPAQTCRDAIIVDYAKPVFIDTARE